MANPPKDKKVTASYKAFNERTARLKKETKLNEP